MRNILYSSVLAILLMSCGVTGPSEAELQAVAKQEMLAQLLPAAKNNENAKAQIKAAVDALKFEKQGICNVQKEIHHCAGEVSFTPPGGAAVKKLVMVNVIKGDKGWQAAP